MESIAVLLAGIVGPCPNCGNGHLEPVRQGDATNFLCRSCRSCWHGEAEWVARVDPRTCDGCPMRDICGPGEDALRLLVATGREYAGGH